MQQVFDVNTKHTARRKWRLLIVDGHGSHLSRAFLTYRHLNKILVVIFLPHSTHTLQPLDVVLFRPLSAAYSKNLTQRFHSSQGLVPVKRGDFFPLFWDAWLMSLSLQHLRPHTRQQHLRGSWKVQSAAKLSLNSTVL